MREPQGSNAQGRRSNSHKLTEKLEKKNHWSLNRNVHYVSENRRCSIAEERGASP